MQIQIIAIAVQTRLFLRLDLAYRATPRSLRHADARHEPDIPLIVPRRPWANKRESL